jgi:ankyrin repeat protein
MSKATALEPDNKINVMIGSNYSGNLPITEIESKMGDSVFIKKFFNENDVDYFRDSIAKSFKTKNFLKVVLCGHGDNGFIAGFKKEYHPAEFFLNIFRDNLSANEEKHLLCEVFTCNSGTGLAKSMAPNGNSVRYKLIPNNTTFVIHGGESSILSYRCNEMISKTCEETDERRLFLDQIIGYPDEMTFLSKVGNNLSTYDNQTLKQTLSSDLNEENIRGFLIGSIEKFLNFYEQNLYKITPEEKKHLSDEYRSKITPEMIAEYRNKSFVSEVAKVSYGDSEDYDYIGNYIKAGIDTKYKFDRGGYTALHMAVLDGSVRMMNYLIDSGFSAEEKSDGGYTVLILALMHKKDEVVKSLIERGVNLEEAMEQNWSFDLKSAVSESARESLNIKKLERELLNYCSHEMFSDKSDEAIKKITDLFKRGASVNYQDNFGRTALYYASFLQKQAIVELLIENKANPDLALNDSGETALQQVVRYKNVALAEILLNGGADINKSDNNLNAPLHFAVDGEDVDMVRFLVSRGADIGAENKDGLTPKQMARNISKGKLIDALKAKSPPLEITPSSGVAVEPSVNSSGKGFCVIS